MRLSPPRKTRSSVTAAVAVVIAGAAGLAATPASAAPADGAAAQALIQEDWSDGRIDLETRLLEEFRYVFAPDRADDRYAPDERTLLRCFTPTVIAFEQNREALSPAATAEIEEYLNPPPPLARASYISPAGLFSFSYLTTGGNAVPLTDTSPANGIPDRVERCAEYSDFSWAHEITTLGFMAPALPADGTYDMSFESMGAYGYTTLSGFSTRIVLHNTFLGFPNNDDPDGNALGAAKVTVAHEFKHASQFTNSGWSEGGWVELDATWAEDIVYPATNDYHNYTNTNGGSVLGQPWTSLDSGGTGSYEDCLWQHYLSGRFGDQVIVDFWDLRRSNPGVSYQATTRDLLPLYGSSWQDSYPGYIEWAWFTGSRSEPPFGFPDALDLKRMNLRLSAVDTFPWSRNDSVARLAGHPYRFNQGAATGRARIVFDGADTIDGWVVSVITEQPDGTFTIVRPELDANFACDYTVPASWSTLEYVGVIVTNTMRSGDVQSYSLNVTDEAPSTGVEPTRLDRLERLALLPSTPNPFRRDTRIRWSAPRATQGSVRIYDISGRLVRTLVDGALPAGAGEVAWDGLDNSGRAVPSGVYWTRIEIDRESVARKVTLLR